MVSKAGHIKRCQDFYLQRVINVYDTYYKLGTIQSMFNELIHLTVPKVSTIVTFINEDKFHLFLNFI